MKNKMYIDKKIIFIGLICIIAIYFYFISNVIIKKIAVEESHRLHNLLSLLNILKLSLHFLLIFYVIHLLHKEKLNNQEHNHLLVEIENNNMELEHKILQRTSELKIANDVLLKEKKNLEDLLDSSPVGVALIVDNIVIYANSALKNMVDIKINANTENIYIDINERNEIINEVYKNKFIKNREMSLYNSNKEIRKVLLSGTFLDFNGQNGFLSWFIDVTDIRNYEKELIKAKEMAEEGTRIKSDFLANMSHEIRTPMNGIIGFTELLESNGLSEKQLDYVYKIKKSVKTLLEIINDILDFSKIEANRLNIEFIEFDLEEILRNISRVNSIKAFDKGIELIIDEDTKILSTFVGDSLRLYQILNNLVDNAIKYTEEGHVTLKVVLEDTKENFKRIYFSITDTGIGISKETQYKLFDAFVQGDGSTTRKYGGTGLGLAISQKLVKMMGGEIKINSSPKNGSTFSFDLILENGRRKKDDKPKEMKSIRNLKALIIESNQSVRTVIKNYLDTFQIHYEEESSGIKAVETIDDTFDFVIIDYKLSVLNGIDIWKKIKNKMYPKTPKALFLISPNSRELIEKIEEEGINEIIMKPILYSEFYNHIKNIYENPIKKSLNFHNKTVDLSTISGSHILIVEDNEINREILRGSLEYEGFIVELAEDSTTAMKKLYEHNFDLLIVDLQIPITENNDFLVETRKVLKFNELPIIAIGSTPISSTREKAREIGINDYLSKPINADNLYEILLKWIKPIKKETNKFNSNLSEKDKNVTKNILNKEQLLNKLLELSLHIEEFDILSKSVFREIKETLIFMKYEKEVLEIESFLERYEFDNAKDICDKIIEQIKG